MHQLQTKAIKAFDHMHSDKIAVFAFDNSSNHHATRPDGLCANSLNLSDGGKHVPLLRETTFRAPDGSTQVQKMQTAAGVQKGVKTILTERGIWNDDLSLQCPTANGGCPLESTSCCARRMLSLQPDFAAQPCWLEDTLSVTGHDIIFFPKFHCELNFIERVWSMAKARARRECDYSFEALYALVPVIMEEIDIASVRRMAQRCYRYMDCYRHGLSPVLANYAVKKYTSHRCIPAGVDNALEDAELVKMLAAEKAAAALAEKAAVVQADAERAVADAYAADNPIPAEVPEGGGAPCTGYVVIPDLESTDRTRYSSSNTVCTVCDQEESEARPFERCERCNIVYHRKCLEPQPQPYGTYLFLCDYPV